LVRQCFPLEEERSVPSGLDQTLARSVALDTVLRTFIERESGMKALSSAT